MEEVLNIFEVEKFVLECNDMLSGRFLDLNKRLEKFLSVMTKSEDILNFLAEALENFDDEKEFAAAFTVDKKTGEAKISLPSDDKKKIALTVTVLNNISNGKLNTNKFLDTYFVDKKITPIKNFLEKIIKPFRDLVCKYFELSTTLTSEDLKKQMDEKKYQQLMQEKEEQEKQPETLPRLEELMGEIVKTCNQILALLKFEKKRTDILDDVEFVVNSVIAACEKKDLMVVNGLVIGLNYVSKKFKNIRHLVDDLNGLIYDYYEFLAGEGKEEEAGIDEEEFEEE